MEPQLPRPQFGGETTSQPSAPAGAERHVARQENSPVYHAEAAGERHATGESLSSGQGGDPLAVQQAFTPPPLPVLQQAPPTDDPAGAQSTGPAVAADDDLIEKEWVEKAKKVVAENRNDPHAQDEAVGRLQADYLKKRYGKVVALPGEG